MKRNLKFRKQKKIKDFLQEWETDQDESRIYSSESEKDLKEREYQSRRKKRIKKITNEGEVMERLSFNIKQAVYDEFKKNDTKLENNFKNCVIQQKSRLNIKICLHCLLEQMDLRCSTCQTQLCNNCFKFHQYTC